MAGAIISAGDIEGVTISGGEPFTQAAPLSLLIDWVRRERDVGVIVYTGYTLAELHQMAALNKAGGISSFLDRIDLLIDGPYIKALDDGLSLRGSSNQMIHTLTDRYAGILDQYYARPARNVEMHFRKEEIFLAGIPGPEVLRKWKENNLIRKP